MDVEVIQKSFPIADLAASFSPHLFEQAEPLAVTLLKTLDHFNQLHILNPQFSVSRFSANTIEHRLRALGDSIIACFALKPFATPQEKSKWHLERFIRRPGFQDVEQTFLTLYQKLAQVQETYFTGNVRKTNFASMLNEVVGWSEHIEIHGHHDIHAVILFAEKIARDIAVIEQRVEVVRDIGVLLHEQAFLSSSSESDPQHLSGIAMELSRIFSPYLLELYDALLEDVEILVIAQQDYEAFEKYCLGHNIELYDEYHDALRYHLQKYGTIITTDIPSACQIIKMANAIVRAEYLCERYKDADNPFDILGMQLTEDIHALQHAIHFFQKTHPDLAEKYLVTLQKVRKLKGEIVKPAIRLYGQYIQSPDAFLEQLPNKHAQWLPILESALACLQPNDDLYQKCSLLKEWIDELIHRKESSAP